VGVAVGALVGTSVAAAWLGVGVQKFGELGLLAWQFGPPWLPELPGGVAACPSSVGVPAGATGVAVLL